jgi:uridylate kinase
MERAVEAPLQAGGRLMAGTAGAKNLRYHRVLLKLSGEALAGNKGYGIDLDVVAPIARDIAASVASGAEICLVVGGGNIYRGLMAAEGGVDRARADYMGMLATVMNGLALQTAIERQGATARVLSAIPMPTVCEAYIRDKALDHLAKGRVVIFTGGTGNPYFTTDTAAALRAAEMGCDALLKATQVDGVYSADPRTTPGARRYDRLSYDDVLKQDLRIMDGAAIALARDNRIPIIVFSIKSQGGLAEVLKGKGSATTIDGGGA